jgi:RNA polymerase sigma factor (sigma-70 family)
MKNWSDEEIIFCLRDESVKRELALKQLYTEVFPTIKSYIQKNNGSEEDAADIFQDAMIVFYEKVRLSEFQLSSSIRTYLYSVCKHLWLNKLRAQKNIISLSNENNFSTVEPLMSAVMNSRERNDYLMNLLNALGNDCKKILILYYYDRLKMKKIAELMNFANDQVAKNKKSSCMKKLKSIISTSPRLKDILR